MFMPEVMLICDQLLIQFKLVHTTLNIYFSANVTNKKPVILQSQRFTVVTDPFQ